MTSVQSSVLCGACSHGNDDTAQFCAGCGQALYEACPKCSASVRKEQKFCGGCGTNLQERRAAQLADLQQWLVQSVEATKASDFDHALMLLERIVKENDYRFAEIRAHAEAAIPKVKNVQQARQQTVNELIAQAREALAQDQKGTVVDLLSRIPEKMQTDQTRQMRNSCSAFVGRISVLESLVQSQLGEKNYEAMAGTMEELLELIPGNEQYLKLARKVTEKLLAASTKRFDRQDYRGAASLLASIPAQMRDHDYESARLRIENVEWLERQFAVEPFAMIALGRLAVRFEQETPHNPNAKQIKDELVRRIKSPVPDPRLPFHPWQGSRQSWLGGSVGYLGYPTCVDYEKPSQLTKLPGRFGIAIGLALQGLGVSRITEGFPVAKKNRLAMLVAKKPTSCWGIDLGTTGLRAVLLTIEKVNPNNSPAKSPEPPVDTGKDRSTNAASVVIRVSEAYSEEFELPLCRLGNDLKSTECIQQAMARFLESVQEKEAPFWVNLPAGDLISRFLRLPPVKDKQAEAFLEVEAKTKIPVPLDTLDMIQWLGAVDSRSAYGRPAFLGAAKKSAVNARVDLLGRCRIKLAGMQADQVALVNYLSHEFGPELMGSSADDSGCFPTFAIIEGGASFTTLHLVNNESFWFWSSESGGEDLTSTLARVGRMTMQAAEDLKRNPAKIDHPHDGFEPVEQRLADFRMRLKKVFAEGVQQNGRVRVDRTWCCGGAPLTHGWIRHMVIKD